MRCYQTILFILLLCLSTQIILSQGIGSGGPDMRPTNALLDGLNLTLKEIGKLTRQNLSILDTTVKYYKKELGLMKDLNENIKTLNDYTEKLPPLTEQLVKLAKDSKISSQQMLKLNITLTFLTITIFLLAFIQTWVPY
jgi:hypothetical protein